MLAFLMQQNQSRSRAFPARVVGVRKSYWHGAVGGLSLMPGECLSCLGEKHTSRALCFQCIYLCVGLLFYLVTLYMVKLN